jgi:hypothetical protein
VARNGEEKAVVIALLILGAFIAGVPLIFVLAAVWQAGFGFNRTTFVLVCAAVALVGVFAFWVKGGAVVTSSEPNPEVVRMMQLGFWERLEWKCKQDRPYTYIGMGIVFLGILLAIAYVEYIEHHLK